MISACSQALSWNPPGGGVPTTAEFHSTAKPDANIYSAQDGDLSFVFIEMRHIKHDESMNHVRFTALLRLVVAATSRSSCCRWTRPHPFVAGHAHIILSLDTPTSFRLYYNNLKRINGKKSPSHSARDLRGILTVRGRGFLDLTSHFRFFLLKIIPDTFVHKASLAIN